MTRTATAAGLLALGLLAAGFAAPAAHTRPPAPAADPLPSWNDTPTKRAITAFVAKVTTEGSADFVPPAERIATFDNDGTLWCEQPMYVEVVFALDRVKALAPEHPEWREKQPFKAILEGDRKAMAEFGPKGMAAVLAATHAGQTVAAFQKAVGGWLATARHPRFDRPYTECVYQPMTELLAYLRANGFKTFIVSGGSADFIRVWADAAYGIPPEQVVGTTFRQRYEVTDGKPAIFVEPHVDLVDDKAGKPVGIARLIGRRPVMAFGNSDGDFEMLEYTTAGPGARFGLIVHHTDAEREYAYDRDSLVGRLDRALAEAPKRGWVVADVKADWKTVFPARRAK